MPQFNDASYGDVTVATLLRDMYALIRDDNETAGADKMKRLPVDVLLGATLGYASQATSRTMTGNVTLSDADGAYQYADPNGADRVIPLPAEANSNHPYIAGHIGSANTVTWQDDASNTIVTLAAGDVRLIVPRSGAWEVVSGGLQAGDPLTDLSSGSATDGQVPTADGAGGIAWENGVTTINVGDLSVPANTEVELLDLGAYTTGVYALYIYLNGARTGTTIGRGTQTLWFTVVSAMLPILTLVQVYNANTSKPVDFNYTSHHGEFNFELWINSDESNGDCGNQTLYIKHTADRNISDMTIKLKRLI